MTPRTLLWTFAGAAAVAALVWMGSASVQAQSPPVSDQTCEHEGNRYLAGERLCIAGLTHICSGATGSWIETRDSC